MKYIKNNIYIRTFLYAITFFFLVFLGLIIYNIYIFYQANISIYESNDVKIESNFSSINLRSDGVYDKGTKTLLAGYTQDNNNFLYTIGRISWYSGSSQPSETLFKLNNLWRNIDISRIDEESHLEAFDKYVLSDSILEIMPSKKGKTYVFDLLVNENKLYISYVNYFKSNIVCDRFSIIALDIDPHSGQLNNPQKIWTAEPCMLVTLDDQWYGFSGRMAADANNIYMITGSIASDMYTHIDLKDNNSSLMDELEDELDKDKFFGSIIKIDKNSNESENFARGFRSPGGLFLDSSGSNIKIWATDHGPRGGDELNFILPGLDYGWPYVSLGEPYYWADVQIQTKYKSHDGYEAPVYYWTPSIGISQVIVLQDDLSAYDDWTKGDLIVSSLKAKSLFHLKIDSKMSVRSSEKIEIGHRIRSLQQLDNALYMSTDDGQIIRLDFSPERLREGPFPPIEKRSHLYKYQYMGYDTSPQPMFSRILKGLDRRIKTAIRKVATKSNELRL